ncbi:MAG: hypothetical protein AAGF71_09910 [Pseudomonadota bacterium]
MGTDAGRCVIDCGLGTEDGAAPVGPGPNQLVVPGGIFGGEVIVPPGLDETDTILDDGSKAIPKFAEPGVTGNTGAANRRPVLDNGPTRSRFGDDGGSLMFPTPE